MRSMARCAFGWLLMAATAVVCFAQMPPSDSTDYAAKVITLTGQVSVLKDNQPWALNPGDSVQVRQIIISGPDGHASFQVSDGSTFEVFPNSTVVFRKNVPNWRDLLDVLVGRVRVHIQKLGNQPNPNRIYTPTAVISVRGTTFDVAVTDQDESTVVEVEEGEVAVQHALRPVGAPKILHAGDSITVYKNYPLQAGGVDRGTILNHGLRALMDALNTAVYRNSRGIPGIGGGGSGGGIPGGAGGPVGDTKGGTTGGGTTGGTSAPPPPPPLLLHLRLTGNPRARSSGRPEHRSFRDPLYELVFARAPEARAPASQACSRTPSAEGPASSS